jgi:hypothetical protein
MSFYSATFKIGDQKFEASASTQQGVRDQMRRAAAAYNARLADCTDVKWFGDTTQAIRGRKPDFVVIDEYAAIAKCMAGQEGYSA